MVGLLIHADPASRVLARTCAMVRTLIAMGSLMKGTPRIESSADGERVKRRVTPSAKVVRSLSAASLANPPGVTQPVMASMPTAMGASMSGSGGRSLSAASGCARERV